MNALKNSLRNCRVSRSHRRKSLYAARLKTTSPGPMIVPFPAFPKKPFAGLANTFVLNHCVKVFG